MNNLSRRSLALIAFTAISMLLAFGPLTPESHAGYGLSVSMSATRSNAVPLAGAVLSGPVYVFSTPGTGVVEARFYLDDPTMSRLPRHVEKNAPHDFAGGNVSLANAFETSTIAEGAHTITVALRLSAGTTTVASATFYVRGKKLVVSPQPVAMSTAPGTMTKVQAALNAVGGTATVTVGDNASWLTVTLNSTTTPATLTVTADARNLAHGKYSATITASAAGFVAASVPVSLDVSSTSATLLLSSQADRSNPRLLAGATVAQNIFVFLGSVTPKRVRFYVDDPGMSRLPFSTELYAPYDLAGGTATAANPFDTRRIPDGAHTITALVDLSTGGTMVLSANFTVSNGTSTTVPSSPSPPSTGRTDVAIYGNRFYINGAITYPATPAEGLLMNARMVNSVFEDTSRFDFNPEANTDEFIRAMPDYVAHGVRAFTLNLQGGYPSYEGAVNTAFRSDGSLKATYLARVKRVIQAADALGAVVILGLFYQRQDQHLASSDAVRAGVVNAMKWITAEGFTNVVVEIANEYNIAGFDRSILRTPSGITSLINLAKSTAPHVYVSASEAYGSLAADIAKAADFILLHGNGVSDSMLAYAIDTFKSYGKPIMINEDPSENVGSWRARLAVQHGASWGAFLRKNQAYPFTFGGSADAPDVYDTIWSFTH